MKNSKIFAALMLSFALASTASVSAATRTATNDTGGPVLISEFPRALVFDANRNSVTADGRLLVCPAQAKTDNRQYPDKCTDANGMNAWIYAEQALASYTLKAYEFRWIGSGYRQLILYFAR